MTSAADISTTLADQVKTAFSCRQPLRINAGNSKAFYGNTIEGDVLNVNAHRGIIEYQPSELVITARSGTPLNEIETALAENNQMLAFEPPLHTEHATFGGAIATGLSGPRRAFTGAARDFVLGTTVINGKGEILSFGGQVMKNVAGYDVSRLMAGAQGTLGVLLDISVKVLPLAEKEITLVFEFDQQTAHDQLRQWILQGHAVSASCFTNNILSVRLSSTESSVNHSISELGGEITDNNIWIQLRHQTHPFFTDNTRLWRLSVPPATEPVLQDHNQLIEWGGALRWIAGEDAIYEQAAALNGHATRYALHTNSDSDPFQPLGPTMLKLHRQLKQAFDPELILNRGRTYSSL